MDWQTPSRKIGKYEKTRRSAASNFRQIARSATREAIKMHRHARAGEYPAILIKTILGYDQRASRLRERRRFVAYLSDFYAALVHKAAFKRPANLFCAGQNPINHDADFLVADSAFVWRHHHRTPNASATINDFFRQIGFGFGFAGIFFRHILVSRAD